MVDYSPWGQKDLDMIEHARAHTHTHTHTHTHPMNFDRNTVQPAVT